MYPQSSIAIIEVLAACCLQLTVFTGTASATATATFVRSDTSTQGNWQASYGSDGYVLANVTPDVPSYATFSASTVNQSAYTWVPSTTDPRALTVPGGSGGIASCWFSSGLDSFTGSVSGTHTVALYMLDWDNQGRAEQVQVKDANSNAVLDTENVSAFTNGVYLFWNISGSVVFDIAPTAGPNAVVSGFFFGAGTGGGAKESVTIAPQTIGLAANSSQQFTASVANGPSQSVTWSIASVSPNGAEPGNFSATTAGLYTAPSTVSAGEVVTVKATTADQQASATATVTLASASSPN